MAYNESKMKEVMEQVVKNLQAKGVKIDGAAIMNFGEGGFNENIEQIIKNTIDEVVDKGKCFCPKCFTFDTFEQVLADIPGRFDYGTIQLDGKTFEAKYHCDLDGNDRMLIRKKEFTPNPSWSTEELQKFLSDAIANKRFQEAQAILDILKTNKK